jgi:hypothetical protein
MQKFRGIKCLDLNEFKIWRTSSKEKNVLFSKEKGCDTYRFGTNINFLLEEYGIMVNSDSVVRTNFYKYFHPKVNFTAAILVMSKTKGPILF